MGELLGICGPIGSGKTTFAEFLADTVEDHAVLEVGEVVADIADAFNQALKAELAYQTTSNSIELANQVLIWLPEALSEHLHHDVVWNQLAIVKHDTLTHPDLYEKLFAYLKQIESTPQLLDAPLTPENKATFRPLLQWLGAYLVAKISKTIWLDEIMRRIALRDPTTSLVIVPGIRYVSDAAVIRAHHGRIIAVARPGIKLVNNDPTEQERDDITPDATIINDGTLAQLRTATEVLTNDILAGNLQKEYQASTL